MEDPCKKFTPWLILLMVLIGPLQLSGAADVLRTTEQVFRPYIPEFPSLPTAILVYQGLMGTSIVVWLYTAWILFRRESGTLYKAQTGYFVGAALRIFGSFSIVLLGGLPAEMTNPMLKEMLPSVAISLVVVVAWSLYLTRSVRVREIYA